MNRELTSGPWWLALATLGWMAAGCGPSATAASPAAESPEGQACPAGSEWNGSSCVALAPSAPAPPPTAAPPAETAGGPTPEPSGSPAEPASSPPPEPPGPPGARMATTASSRPPLAMLNQDRIELAEPIRFEVGTHTIVRESQPVLEAVVAILTTFPTMQLEVGAHTDSRGAAGSNKALSQARADAVRAYLVGQGIAASRVTAVGHGEDQPIDTNNTAAGRARNRRIELRVR